MNWVTSVIYYTDHVHFDVSSRRQSDTLLLLISAILALWIISPDKKKNGVKLKIFTYASVLTFVLGAQQNRLIATVLLSTHNICFGI